MSRSAIVHTVLPPEFPITRSGKPSESRSAHIADIPSRTRGSRTLRDVLEGPVTLVPEELRAVLEALRPGVASVRVRDLGDEERSVQPSPS